MFFFPKNSNAKKHHCDQTNNRIFKRRVRQYIPAKQKTITAVKRMPHQPVHPVGFDFPFGGNHGEAAIKRHNAEYH